MEVHIHEKAFKKIFFTNLKDLWERTWVYRLYRFFTRGLVRFFRNLWWFRRILWEYNWWDYRFTLNTLKTCLIPMHRGLENHGLEIEETRLPKIRKIKRVVEILDNIENDNYLERAEAELGEMTKRDFEFEPSENNTYRMVDRRTDAEREHDKKIIDRSREIEQAEWEELWDTLKGQDPSEWINLSHQITIKDNTSEYDEAYYKWYDGSDMRGWWD